MLSALGQAEAELARIKSSRSRQTVVSGLVDCVVSPRDTLLDVGPGPRKRVDSVGDVSQRSKGLLAISCHCVMRVQRRRALSAISFQSAHMTLAACIHLPMTSFLDLGARANAAACQIVFVAQPEYNALLYETDLDDLYEIRRFPIVFDPVQAMRQRRPAWPT